MRHVPEALQSSLSEETLTLCLCWRLTRSDGRVFGLTSHDQALTVGSEVFVPGAALDTSVFVHGADLQPGRVEALGALRADFIEDADLRAGVWHACRVDIYRVDWQAPDLGKLHIWSGAFSELTLSDQGQFKIGLVSQMAELQRPIGRVLQRRCDAVLGDARCGISADGRVCDHRVETCRDVFDNIENFRGFPHLPGPDFLLAGPAASQNDGGQR
ncbi:MAG: DUF2163 domain-containing protein [Pseudomonadota bacterium]